MPEIHGLDVMQTAGMIAAAIIASIFGIQRLLKGWKETSTETSIIGMMHEELTRLSEQNSKLALELNKFQLEVVKLGKQVHELTVENSRLQLDISKLNEILEQSKREKDCDSCEYKVIQRM